MTVDPYILNDPAFYKAIEEILKGNIPGGEALEVAVQDAVRDLSPFNVMFSCSRVTHFSLILETEAMWDKFQASGLDDSVRVPMPFTGRFGFLIVNIIANTLDAEMDVSFVANGAAIGSPQEHVLTFAAGGTGTFVLPTVTSFVFPIQRMSFLFSSPTSIAGNARGSASILLVKEDVII